MSIKAPRVIKLSFQVIPTLAASTNPRGSLGLFGLGRTLPVASISSVLITTNSSIHHRESIPLNYHQLYLLLSWICFFIMLSHDLSSRMNQHTDLSRGIQFDVCKAPDLRCNREICGGGQCHERSYPFFEPVNFACDCSASDKTFREGVEDIRRSEACNRGM